MVPPGWQPPSPGGIPAASSLETPSPYLHCGEESWGSQPWGREGHPCCQACILTLLASLSLFLPGRLWLYLLSTLQTPPALQRPPSHFILLLSCLQPPLGQMAHLLHKDSRNPYTSQCCFCPPPPEAHSNGRSALPFLLDPSTNVLSALTLLPGC